MGALTRSIARALALLSLAALISQHASAYYLPGSFPNEYKVNATMMGMCVERCRRVRVVVVTLLLVFCFQYTSKSEFSHVHHDRAALCLLYPSVLPTRGGREERRGKPWRSLDGRHY